jgi:hypothetical protein
VRKVKARGPASRFRDRPAAPRWLLLMTTWPKNWNASNPPPKSHGHEAGGCAVCRRGSLAALNRGRMINVHLLLAVAPKCGSVLLFLRLVTGRRGEQRKGQYRSHLILLSMARH